jgi:hypothetical protein
LNRELSLFIWYDSVMVYSLLVAATEKGAQQINTKAAGNVPNTQPINFQTPAQDSTGRGGSEWLVSDQYT